MYDGLSKKSADLFQMYTLEPFISTLKGRYSLQLCLVTNDPRDFSCTEQTEQKFTVFVLKRTFMFSEMRYFDPH